MAVELLHLISQVIETQSGTFRHAHAQAEALQEALSDKAAQRIARDSQNRQGLCRSNQLWRYMGEWCAEFACQRLHSPPIPIGHRRAPFLGHTAKAHSLAVQELTSRRLLAAQDFRRLLRRETSLTIQEV